MSVSHYENFPVASVVLPARLRRPIIVIYAFARSADDIADEGDAAGADRLAALSGYRAQLDAIARRERPAPGLFAALTDVVTSHGLPLEPFYDLLDAFSQDVVKHHYDTHADLLDYCRRSANPIGRLLLHLFDAHTARNVADSDRICSGLQLANFWQDVAVDLDKGRVYLPREDLARFGASPHEAATGHLDPRWAALMAFEVERTKALLSSGAPLAARLRGRIGFELALIVEGGLRILERIERCRYDVFRHRPTLGLMDWPLIATRAVRTWRSSARACRPAQV